jgi:hypothetical protein
MVSTQNYTSSLRRMSGSLRGNRAMQRSLRLMFTRKRETRGANRVYRCRETSHKRTSGQLPEATSTGKALYGKMKGKHS